MTGVTCTGLDLQSRQGDRAITGILRQFGAQARIGPPRAYEAGNPPNVDTGPETQELTVYGGDLRGIDIDARDIPDLVPILAVVATAAKGQTTIYNAGRLRGKESDRLSAITDVLSALGADIREKEDGLIISGGLPLKGGRVSSWNDHRIVMAAAIAASICTGPVTITGAEAVNKTYPGFFNDLGRLRQNINR